MIRDIVNTVKIPTVRELMLPVLVAIKELGGSAAIAELDNAAIKIADLADEQVEEVFPDGTNNAGKSKVIYRLAWARTHLRLIGALVNSQYGVWAITEQGRTFLSMERATGVGALSKAWAEYEKKRRLESPGNAADEEDDEGSGEDGEHWKKRLIDVLRNMTPTGFERLTQRLLREAGFQNVEVLGRSGDGGIDGVGVYRVSLVSFPTYFQCKRVAGSVSAGVVRDFRGAMSGRGEKGLLVTTGTFTAAAKAEAIRDGAPPVDLVEAEELCDLLKQYGLGVGVEMVEQVNVQAEFFAGI